MFKFTYNYNILFGYDTVNAVGEEVRKLGCKKALICCDEGIIKVGLTKKVENSLRSAGIEYVIFKDIQPEPEDTVIDAGADFAKMQQVDCVVAVGGGSSIDGAKAISMLLNNPGSIKDYFSAVAEKEGVPLIAIPTTAGTGSDLSFGGMITDHETHIKHGFSTPNPTLAISDPGLTLTMPVEVTRVCAVDVLAHCIESLTSQYPNHIIDLIAEDGIRAVAKWLPVVLEDGLNREAREAIMLASSTIGSGICTACPHLGHGIGHHIGGALRIVHGYSVIACMPEILKFIAMEIPDRVGRVGKALGAVLPEDASAAQIGDAAAEALKKLLIKTGVPSLKELGYREEQLKAVIPEIMADNLVMLSPRAAMAEDIARILEKSIAY